MNQHFGMTKQQFNLIAALGILNLIVICGLGAIVVKSSSSTSPATPPTMIQATATSEPTRAPIPTWTPVIQQSKSINTGLDEYIGTVKPLLIGMTAEVGLMSDLMQQAGENAYLIQTEDWNMQMRVTLLSIDDYAEMVRNVSPPTNVTHCHRTLRNAMDKYNLVTAYIAMGIETNSGEYIIEAGKQIESATSDMNNFNLCIRKVK